MDTHSVVNVKTDFATFSKGVYSKKKEFAPFRLAPFLVELDPYSEGALGAEKQTGSPKSCDPHHKCTLDS